MHIQEFHVFGNLRILNGTGGWKHILKKVRKGEKQNVNGAVDVQYVLLKFVMAAGFHSMCYLTAEKSVPTL